MTFHAEVNIAAVAIVVGAFFTAFIYPPLAMRKATRQSCVALARAVEAREPFLLGHSELTAQLVVAMARKSLRFWPWQIRNIENAALLHLIGKVGVPHAILNSEFGLNGQERFALREYVRIGAQIVEAIPPLKGAASAILSHREYLDGTGYPFGRFGDSIPLEARILCVATEYISMTRPRIYRGSDKELSHSDALEYLQQHAGTRYDLEAIELLKQAVNPQQNLQLLRRQPRKIATAAD